MVFIYQLPRFSDQFFIQPYPLRDGKSIRASRLAYLQLIQWQQILFVKLHSSIDDTRELVGHNFQAQVMCCSYSDGMLICELFHDHFSKGAAEIRITSASQLVYKK